MPKIENIHYDTYDNNLVMKLKLLKLSHNFFFFKLKIGVRYLFLKNKYKKLYMV